MSDTPESTFDTRVNDALKRWIADREGIDVDEIVAAEYQDTTSWCGEGTCEFAEVTIDYRIGNGYRTIRYGETASDFILGIAKWMSDGYREQDRP